MARLPLVFRRNMATAMASDSTHTGHRVLVELLRFNTRDREAQWESGRRGIPLIDLVPHGTNSVLLGDNTAHRFDRVTFTSVQDQNDIDNARTLRSLCGVEDDHSLVFNSLPVDFPVSVSDTSGAPLDTGPATGLPSPCPFVRDPEANRQNWDALHDEEADEDEQLVAMNILTVPDPDAYAEYAAHFTDLPTKYGFQVLQCTKLPLKGGRDGAYTMLVAVAFPNARAFASCWSDPVIRDEAFPLRDNLFAGGFRHIWLRCAHKL